MAISQRLMALADMVSPGGVVADIGCDHGYLAQYLLNTGRAKSVIATDISAPSLKKAQILLRPFAGRASVRLGAGLEVLRPGEADTIVIAGMGGHEIVSIVQKSSAQAKESALILGPHRDVPLLRAYLLDAGFVLREERLVLERGVWYTFLRAEAGIQSVPYTPLEIELGRYEHSDELKTAYLCARKQSAQSVLQKLREAGAAEQKARTLEDLIRQIDQMLDEDPCERHSCEYERTGRLN